MFAKKCRMICNGSNQWFFFRSRPMLFFLINSFRKIFRRSQPFTNKRFYFLIVFGFGGALSLDLYLNTNTCIPESCVFLSQYSIFRRSLISYTNLLEVWDCADRHLLHQSPPTIGIQIIPSSDCREFGDISHTLGSWANLPGVME